jgi:hypothetical protein
MRRMCVCVWGGAIKTNRTILLQDLKQLVKMISFDSLIFSLQTKIKHYNIQYIKYYAKLYAYIPNTSYTAPIHYNVHYVFQRHMTYIIIII